MSVEGTVFILRLLAGLSLAGFLLALFVIIWRDMQAKLPSDEAGMRLGSIALLGQEGDRQAERWQLRPLVTLGRGGGNSIVVQDDFASAEHARISLDKGKWWLEDRQSRNGTTLNETRIERRTVLADGDVIGIGKRRYRIEISA